MLNKNKNKMLSLLRNYLTNSDISYWLEYGSLLGAVREKKIISHDYDIDIGILQSEWSKNIREQLKSINFDLVREIKIDGVVYEESYQYNQILIDFFYCPLKENIISIPVFRPFTGLTWEQSLQEKKGLELY
ncbi:LicD family protein, partial [Providencia rettgeri]|nr:LicD family protein [Providencia rettgeri]